MPRFEGLPPIQEENVDGGPTSNLEAGGTGRRKIEFSYENIDSDARYQEMLEERSLEFLKTQDREYFEREFTGELDKEGYLIRKDGGRPNTKPSQNIGGGKALEQVLGLTKGDFTHKYPDEAKKYGL